MKYMGSKRAMLANGLGSLIARRLAVNPHARFVDLFAGSAAVAWHVAENYKVEVIATDIQLYAKVLAGAILGRATKRDAVGIWNMWIDEARPIFKEIGSATTATVSASDVFAARAWAEYFPDGTLVRAYGGHYYSPTQIAWIEALRHTLPRKSVDRDLCLAALIIAGSRAAAAPGHTAQPFQPTPTALRFLNESWSRDVLKLVQTTLQNLCGRHAMSSGSAIQSNANEYANSLRQGDLAFVDPPYSGVHYSRFYHVLESIAKGRVAGVSGVGRYAPAVERPSSAYSAKSTALNAVQDLLSTLASRRAEVIFTFPSHLCSNGLTGPQIEEIAHQHFVVEAEVVKSSFSTLGGGRPGAARGARQSASELLLLLRPR
jgi:adenine-specific DNA-methyltransferase